MNLLLDVDDIDRLWAAQGELLICRKCEQQGRVSSIDLRLNDIECLGAAQSGCCLVCDVRNLYRV